MSAAVLDEAWGAAESLRDMLAPMQPLLDDPALTDLYINGPGEGSVERAGRKERFDPPYSLRDLEDLAILAAALNQGGDVGPDAPFAEGLLPGGHRVHTGVPPATGPGKVAIAVRRPSPKAPTMEERRARGAFADTVSGSLPRGRGVHAHLLPLYRSGDHCGFVQAAAASGLNIIFSGAQRAGKTTWLRSALDCVRDDARVAPVQDLDEMPNIKQWDCLPLYYNKGNQGRSKHGAEGCVHACVRLGVQVLPFQEVRDGAGYSLLYAMQAGIQLLSTTHANSAEDTFGRLASLVKRHPEAVAMDEGRLMGDLRSLIDVVAFCVKDETAPEGQDKYRIEQVWYEPGMQEEASHA